MRNVLKRNDKRTENYYWESDADEENTEKTKQFQRTRSVIEIRKPERLGE
jgi:hypothetical protein